MGRSFVTTSGTPQGICGTEVMSISTSGSGGTHASSAPEDVPPGHSVQSSGWSSQVMNAMSAMYARWERFRPKRFSGDAATPAVTRCQSPSTT